jgi:hypothetical protein
MTFLSQLSSKWVGFWFCGSLKYPKPPNMRSLKRVVRAKSSHNLSKVIKSYQSCIKDEEASFRLLKMSKKVKEKTWVATLQYA